jgi:hypothetical protein
VRKLSVCVLVSGFNIKLLIKHLITQIYSENCSKCSTPVFLFVPCASFKETRVFVDDIMTSRTNKQTSAAVAIELTLRLCLGNLIIIKNSLNIKKAQGKKERMTMIWCGAATRLLLPRLMMLLLKHNQISKHN